ncbi:MAG TPA: AAA family ATPase [Candidatus Diapherotrites archaeon]|uniref:ORC1-type DNA replication protein n=4 Tax=Candidatus Iainarchaeum sp. TaxID=3101447 RepID=A0A7J4KYF2_9ARCH|nr:AAA family ATPase [Candidatus Diapherotrites archaeon]
MVRENFGGFQLANLFEQELQKQSVFLNRDAISQHFIPKELPFREKQLKEISSILTAALQGKKPNNVFVYGKVGTGKTCVVRHVLQELQEFKQKSSARVESCYINCRVHNSKYKALQKCCKEFYPSENFLGYSAAFVFEKILDFARKNKNQVLIALDEIDKVKDLDELVYALSRGNDELEQGEGAITIIGISNNVLFKERLDARTKSSLCQEELVFAPYNAEELKEILKQRVEIAFKPKSVQESALNLAAAIAAQESGDARTAVLLLLRAGELSDKESKEKVSDEEVKKAKSKVEEEVIYNMIATLPDQEQLVLYTIALLAAKQKPLQKITGQQEPGALMSGEVFEEYKRVAKKFKESNVSARWFRAYLNELETYGIISTTKSGPGMVGNTRLIRLNPEASKVKESIEKEISG